MPQMTLMPTRPKGQLLKWVGNKYRYAHAIIEHFPVDYNKYVEPFVGTGAVLATLSPERALAGDTLEPLIEMWDILRNDPECLIEHYENEITRFYANPNTVYEEIRSRYNSFPNGLDLVVLSRTCYGGVVRFTREGTMSTPMGPHKPIAPREFAARVGEWRERVEKTIFRNQSFEQTLKKVEAGDIVYCDPPYLDSQTILYGAQNFNFSTLIDKIADCKARGAKIALSIDGKKKSGRKTVDLCIPEGLFQREIFIGGKSSMLRRFQNSGKVMIGEDVHERLLLTW